MTKQEIDDMMRPLPSQREWYYRHSRRYIIDEALTEQPAQQEPVAVMTVLHLKDRTEIGYGPALAGYDLPTGEYKLYTSPHPSKPWIGLTDKEFEAIIMSDPHATVPVRLWQLIQDKLKEKNT